MEASLQSRVDLTLLTQNMGGNGKVIPKLFEVFWKSSDETIRQMEKALKTKDLKQWQFHAHSLKGAARSVTARRIASICEECEHLNALKKKEAAALLYHLNKEVAILRELIKNQIA